MINNLIKWLEKIVSDLRSPYVEVKTHPEWYKIAIKEVGIIEIKNGENPRILEYHLCTKLKATNDETPWCSSFACWCLEQCGVNSPRSAWAQSFLEWGSDLLNPKEGCIAVFKRGAGGHVGFYVNENKNSIFILGGNQKNSVCISEYPKENLLGFRWPMEAKT